MKKSLAIALALTLAAPAVALACEGEKSHQAKSPHHPLFTPSAQVTQASSAKPSEAKGEASKTSTAKTDATATKTAAK